jgi:hypothetical protein
MARNWQRFVEEEKITSCDADGTRHVGSTFSGYSPTLLLAHYARRDAQCGLGDGTERVRGATADTPGCEQGWNSIGTYDVMGDVMDDVMGDVVCVCVCVCHQKRAFTSTNAHIPGVCKERQKVKDGS